MGSQQLLPQPLSESSSCNVATAFAPCTPLGLRCTISCAVQRSHRRACRNFSCPPAPLSSCTCTWTLQSKMTDKGLTDEAVAAACKDGNPITKDFMMQQTMLRVKDPVKSLDFYTRILGMTLLQRFDFPSMRFSLYFLGYEDKKEIPGDVKERTAWTFSRRATIELTHQSYHNGNSDPRGFGHIGIAVPDVYAACKLFEEQGVTFVKKPDDGKMKGLAFIQDPDGYWIEILSPNNMVSITT
ncbi:hypothetical protein JZ751_003162 [Albula glossodonta]|uniref:Lactoylglutathione lyase n=1 Tax=Albula glossodonta TaxID=121402 RepID=A0A8T2NA42_9TELE|nr:hypothetical protein JZ751_003162 [Albula glossodonta]